MGSGTEGAPEEADSLVQSVGGAAKSKKKKKKTAISIHPPVDGEEGKRNLKSRV